MANTFKSVSQVMPASAGTFETLYTCPTSPATTTVVIGLMIANEHTSQITYSIKHVSTTTASGNGRENNNQTTFLQKDIPLAVGETKQALVGGKHVMNQGDLISVDASVTDKVSVTMSIMEIT